MPVFEPPKAKIAGSGRVLTPDGVLRTDTPPQKPEEVKPPQQKGPQQ